MKQLILSTIYIFSFYLGHGQTLSFYQRDSIRLVMEKVGVNDQKYRWALDLGELNSQRLDSLKALPYPTLKIRRQQVQAGKVGFNKQTRDSLWQLQTIIDRHNKQILLDIIKVYGYPSNKRIRGRCDPYTLVLHLVSEENFKELLQTFQSELSKGNMPPHDYASWYDRSQLTMGKKQLYGEYISEYPCVDNLEKTNTERKKIRLSELQTNNCK